MATVREGIYDLLTSVSIDTKEAGRTRVDPWLSQRIVIDAVAKGLKEDVHEFVILKCRQVACCVDPGTRVLTADLRWLPIAELRSGQEIISVDESPPGGRGAARQMRTATVQAVVQMQAPAFRITFNDGRSIICTATHPWLSRKESTEWEWRSIARSARGGRNGGNVLTVGTKVRWITRPWEGADYDDGWFGGMLDGEGSMAKDNQPGTRVLITQRPGPVYDRMKRYLDSRNYNFGALERDYERDSKFGADPVWRLVISRQDEVFRLLGQTRPTRFIGRKFWEGRELPGKKSGVGWSEIVNIEPLGEQTVVDLQTSTGTYIAEGFVSHNTTVCSVIELFWALANPGTQGAIIADRTDNLERLRRIFASLLETLPTEWRGSQHKLVQNNRTGMAFANKSVIDLLAAASNPDLGASRALNMVHATECSQWKSLAGVESLKAALARQNPNRLYIWESIANGLNWYYHFCQQAKADRRMKFIFIGFWAQPTYSIPKSDPDYKIYWDGHLTEDEIRRARFVKQEYNYIIKPEQIAWWRRESEFRAEEYMMRHYPWHEKECFIASGSGFFPAARTMEIAEALAPASPPYKGYRYDFNEKFLSSRIEQVTDPDQAMLKIWEPPEPGGIYVIGVDPSGGGGGESDDHAIEVLRCYSDKIVQVAEFQSNRPFTYQLAWVLAHLAGAYRDHIANLEVTGIGAAVLPEVRNLRQLAEHGILQGEPGTQKILDMIGSVRWFLYKRPDTLGGAGNVIAWKANADNKYMVYSELRDSLMLRRLEIRSPNLITQMQAIVEDDGYIGAGTDTGAQDDLVSALVLAHHAWVEWRRPGLVARKLSWESVKGEAPPQDMATVLSFAFSQKMASINRKAHERKEKF